MRARVCVCVVCGGARCGVRGCAVRGEGCVVGAGGGEQLWTRRPSTRKRGGGVEGWAVAGYMEGRAGGRGGGECGRAHDPERERRGILSTLSEVSLCEALLLPTDLLLAGAMNPPEACDVPARWLLWPLWMWMVEDPLCGCCAGGGSIDPSSKSMSNCVSLSPRFRFCGSPAGDLCG